MRGYCFVAEVTFKDKMRIFLIFCQISSLIFLYKKCVNILYAKITDFYEQKIQVYVIYIHTFMFQVTSPKKIISKLEAWKLTIVIAIPTVL